MATRTTNKIFNDAREATNKKHECQFCDNKMFKNRYGAHLFNNHAEELIKKFMPYKNIKTPSFPFSAGGLYVCFCCREVWTSEGYAKNHIKHHPNCTIEAQSVALYKFLSIEPPTDGITVQIKRNNAVEKAIIKEAAEESDMLIAQRQKMRDEFYRDKTKLEQKIAYLEKRYTLDTQLLAAQRDKAYEFCSQDPRLKKYINDMASSPDRTYELIKLQQNILDYVKNTFTDDKLFVGKKPAPAPEPVPEPAPEPVPEPAPEPVAAVRIVESQLPPVSPEQQAATWGSLADREAMRAAKMAAKRAEKLAAKPADPAPEPAVASANVIEDALLADLSKNLPNKKELCYNCGDIDDWNKVKCGGCPNLVHHNNDREHFVCPRNDRVDKTITMCTIDDCTRVFCKDCEKNKNVLRIRRGEPCCVQCLSA